jgi:hypothetical protein
MSFLAFNDWCQLQFPGRVIMSNGNMQESHASKGGPINK